MSLGHTFSSALHYTGPVTSSATPIKAIQAKSCASPPFFFLFFLVQMRSVTKHHSLISSLLATSVLFSNLNYWIKTYEVIESEKTHSAFIYRANFGGDTFLK